MTELVKSRLCLKGMEFYAYFGWHQAEQVVGGHYTVDVCFEFALDTTKEINSLEQTYDYERVFNEVKVVMQEHIPLIEEVARRILMTLKKIFNNPDLLIEVSLTKHNPPIGHTNYSSITLKA